MKDPRASKRRRVSEEPAHDGDGDIAMESDGDAYSVPSSPEPEADSDEDQDYRGPRRQASRRQSTRARKSNVPGGLGDDTAETPRSTRTSGRQRKAPQRLEDAPTPTSTRRTAATPRSARGTRSTRKPRQESVEDVDMEDDQSPVPTGTIARTRSRRSTAKTRSNGANANAAGEADGEISPSEGYNDGLDDLVAMQLQQGLQADEELQEAEELADPLPDYAEKLQALCQSGLQDEVRLLTTTLLEKLSGKRRIPLKGLETEYTKVCHLIEQTVTVGEGNSMLLLGSRGSGKTAIVETIISSLAKEHGNDFHVVRLNGFLHTDDRLALREMWRQLGRETHTEDDAAKVSSYADTMATLLALLSHPEELFGAGNGDNVTAAKSVVILLDEFDLFVTHPRQTLLYNLFDIAQARKAPIAVIGLTTKVDVTEMLEKRVKSRFSHRYVYIPLPKTYETFSEICMTSLDLDENEVEELAAGLGVENSITKSARWNKLLDGWKEYLQNLCNDKEFQFHLKKIYYRTKSVKEFLTSALLPISELHLSSQAVDKPTFPIPTPKSFATQSLACPDPAPLPFSTSMTASFSPSSLPLALLLAATRLSALFDPSNDGPQTQSIAPLALSFPAAYAEYVRLLTSAKTSASISGAAATPGRVWGRDVARESWEKLVTWGLVTPVGSGNGTADGQMFRVEISFEEVVELAGTGSSLGQWWRE
ncbi:Origin recognition complex subunit 4 [Penicillium rolfsii]|nr:Origin recognition complex subunit 4 [Penicillium rolfsii]